jgi:hypothetical protein
VAEVVVLDEQGGERSSQEAQLEHEVGGLTETDHARLAHDLVESGRAVVATMRAEGDDGDAFDRRLRRIVHGVMLAG